jgi:hypothetical protein
MSEAAYRLGAAQGAAAELEAYLHPREAAKPREAAVETETDRLRRIGLSERDIAVCLQGQSK